MEIGTATDRKTLEKLLYAHSCPYVACALLLEGNTSIGIVPNEGTDLSRLVACDHFKLTAQLANATECLPSTAQYRFTPATEIQMNRYCEYLQKTGFWKCNTLEQVQKSQTREYQSLLHKMRHHVPLSVTSIKSAP